MHLIHTVVHKPIGVTWLTKCIFNFLIKNFVLSFKILLIYNINRSIYFNWTLRNIYFTVYINFHIKIGVFWPPTWSKTRSIRRIWPTPLCESHTMTLASPWLAVFVVNLGLFSVLGVRHNIFRHLNTDLGHAFFANCIRVSTYLFFSRATLRRFFVLRKSPS